MQKTNSELLWQCPFNCMKKQFSFKSANMEYHNKILDRLQIWRQQFKKSITKKVFKLLFWKWFIDNFILVYFSILSLEFESA